MGIFVDLKHFAPTAATTMSFDSCSPELTTRALPVHLERTFAPQTSREIGMNNCSFAGLLAGYHRLDPV